MGLLANVVERREQRQSTLAAPSDWLRNSLAGPRSATGAVVSVDKALGLAAFYACVSLIAETIASLPWFVYQRTPSGGKQRVPNHPLYPLLHDSPNPEMTSFEFREALVGHIETWGNAYAEIEFDQGNRPIALWPLRPDKMTVTRAGGQERNLTYTYTVPSGRNFFLPSERVLHWKGLSPDGLIGYSRISLMREAIGLGIGLEEYQARFFGNDSRPGGVLEVPGRLSDDAAKRLVTRWESAHQGLGHAHRVAVLEEGVSWKSVGIPPQDSQFIESRKFQRGEIAMMMRVPPHMIGDIERQTSWGTGIEQQQIGFVQFTLRSRLVRMEQGTAFKLFMPSERSRYLNEFEVDGLLRGDSKARAEYLQTLRQNGVINAAQWASLENLPPPPPDVGSVYILPANMVPVDQLVSPPEPPPVPSLPDGGGGGETQPALPPPSTGRLGRALTTAREVRDYHCRKCGRLLFRSPDERGRIETVCPQRQCRELQTVFLQGVADG